ncbi:MAG: efflux RND transporter periplasmic adaptor subunit [Pedobacter sp.]|nr:efflux RND transporter periplasmic adaptor subunit [Pedobacter sp.]
MNLKSLLQPRVIVAVVIAALVATLFVACRGKDDAALRYRSEAVDRGDITQTVSANGTLNPVTLVSVGTQVSGTVKKLYVDYNDRVEQGQVLVMLDDALLKAQLAQDSANLAAAENALKVARNNLVRVRDLNKEGFVSQQELDTAEQASQDAIAKVTQLRASVDKDHTNIGYSVIRSPVSGVVVSRSVDEGQTVAASFNTPELFKIAKDLREMQIDAYFAEADIGQIKVGQKVKFRVDAFSGQRFTGTVKQIRLNPKTDSNVVTYDVVIAVANPDEKLLPGMTAYVDIGVQHRVDVLRVPNAALRFKPTDDSNVEKTADEKAGDKNAPAEGGRKPGGNGGGAGGPIVLAAADTGEASPEGERRPRREMSEEERAAWRAKRQAEGGDGENRGPRRHREEQQADAGNAASPEAIANKAAPAGKAPVVKADAEKPAAAHGEGKMAESKPAAEEAEAGGRRGRAGANNVGRVYVLRDGKLTQIKVKIGITDRRYTELTSDELKEGDQVVVEEVDPKNAGKPAGQQRGMQFGM